MCAEGHSLPQTRHRKRVRDGQESEVLAERHLLHMQEHDRLVSERREGGIDACDDVRDTTRKFIGFGGLKGYLNEDNL